MKMFSSKSRQMTRDESLACVPVKNNLVKESCPEPGALLLSYPVAYKSFFKKIRGLIRKNPDQTFTRKIQLDRLGMDVWQLLDGEKTVRAIIKEFADLHQLHPKEAEASVTLFMKSLGEKGLILIQDNST